MPQCLAPVVFDQIGAEPVVEVQRWALGAIQVQPIHRSDVPKGVVANDISQVHQRVLISDAIERPSVLALLYRVLDQVALIQVELATWMTVDLTVRPTEDRGVRAGVDVIGTHRVADAGNDNARMVCAEPARKVVQLVAVHDVAAALQGHVVARAPSVAFGFV